MGEIQEAFSASSDGCKLKHGDERNWHEAFLHEFPQHSMAAEQGDPSFGVVKSH